MKALVFEQWQGGHYFNYLECLVPKLAGMCSEVVVAVTASAASSDLFASQLGHLRNISNVRIDTGATIPDGKSGLAARFAITKNVIEASERNKPDFVFLPSADEQILTMPLLALSGSQRSLRGVPIEAVIHYKSYTACASARERMLSAAQRALLKTGAFSQLNFVSFLQYEQALARKLPLAKMARAAGDPVPQAARIARESARSQMGLRPDGRLIGMIGGLDERKAVPATLSAFRASRLSSSDRLLLAGKLAPGFAQLIQRDYSDLVQRGALIVMDRYLDEGELANCFAAVNLHCSVYNDFSGLSSLMLKSVAAGIPVIVSDRPGWSRAVVRRFGVGSVVDPTDTDSFARGLRDALESSESYRESEAVRRLLRFHSIANFTEGITGRLRSLLGKSASTQVVEWCWVSEALDPANRALT